jgi:hypothetical protein
MSNLVDLNRFEFKKIFDAHQHKNILSYTDSLKICTSLKIFPDLLTSQEIRKIFVTLAGESGERMTYLQFESFLKIIAKQVFTQAGKKRSDDCSKLITHIKEPSFNRYGTNLELSKKTSSSKPIKRQKSTKISISTPKNAQKNSFFTSKPLDQTFKYKSPNKLAVPKINGIANLLSPSIKSLKSRIDSLKPALTERKDGHTSACSTSPSPNKPSLLTKISKIFSNFQVSMTSMPKKNYKAQEKLKNLMKSTQSSLILRLSFNLWRLQMKSFN